MSLDEARDDETAAAVAHQNGALPSFPVPRPGPFTRPRLPHRGDAPALDRYVRPDHAPAALVQQHVTAGENQIGSGRHGAQVVIRGCTAVESSERSK